MQQDIIISGMRSVPNQDDEEQIQLTHFEERQHQIKTRHRNRMRLMCRGFLFILIATALFAYGLYELYQDGGQQMKESNQTNPYVNPYKQESHASGTQQPQIKVNLKELDQKSASIDINDQKSKELKLNEQNTKEIQQIIQMQMKTRQTQIKHQQIQSLIPPKTKEQHTMQQQPSESKKPSLKSQSFKIDNLQFLSVDQILKQIAKNHVYFNDINFDEKPNQIQRQVLKVFHRERITQINRRSRQTSNLYRTSNANTELTSNTKINLKKLLRGINLSKITGSKQLISDLQNESRAVDKLKEEQRTHISAIYPIQKYEQLPLCVVVSTFNNIMNFRYYYNLQSILQQDYNSYRVIIIDDASHDKTASKIKQLLKSKNISEQVVKLIKNKQNAHPMINYFYTLYKECRKGEILVAVDGDDELIGTQVFKTINAVYQQTNARVVYSNFLRHDPDRMYIGMSKQFSKEIIENNLFRDKPVIFSHLRTYKTELFYAIKPSDFFAPDGQFLQIDSDYAIFYPGLEMACGKIQYIPELFYKYTGGTGLNDYQIHGKKQSQIAKYLKKKQKYQCLKQL